MIDTDRVSQRQEEHDAVLQIVLFCLVRSVSSRALPQPLVWNGLGGFAV